MSWTKQQLIVNAFEELGYSDGLSFQLDSIQLDSGLRRLDAMMALWSSLNIDIGYPLTTSPGNSSLNTETNIPTWAVEAVYTNLALKLAPTIGKEVSLITRQTAKVAYQAMLRNLTKPMSVQLPTTLPAGAGNKTWRYNNPFIERELDTNVTPPDNEVEFNG